MLNLSALRNLHLEDYLELLDVVNSLYKLRLGKFLLLP